MRNAKKLVGTSVPLVGLALLVLGLWLTVDGSFNIGVPLDCFGIILLVVGQLPYNKDGNLDMNRLAPVLSHSIQPFSCDSC